MYDREAIARPRDRENGAVRIFRRRPPALAAEITEGFWVTEAPAFRQPIRSALTGAEVRQALVPVEVAFGRGAEERVVVLLRNFIVGFVPEDRATDIRVQLAAAGQARLTTSARVHQEDGEWRIWAGPPWPDGASPPDYPAPTIRPSPPAIFGIQLRTGDS